MISDETNTSLDVAIQPLATPTFEKTIQFYFTCPIKWVGTIISLISNNDLKKKIGKNC